MNSIIITDIYSNKLSQDKDMNGLLPFIIINITQPLFLLEKVKYINDNDSIWKINLRRMFAMLYTHGINPSGFSLLGDLWFPSQSLPQKVQILLVNVDNRLSQFPINFVNIDQNIWKPVGPDGFQAIGLIHATTKPSLRSLKVVNKSYLLPYNKTSPIIDKKTSMNEFNLLSIIGIDRYTIDRTQFLPNSPKIDVRLSSKSSGKYITNYNDTIVLNNEQQNNIDNVQTVSYTGNGELKMNGMCMDLHDNDTITLEKCNQQMNQKWYPYDDAYISYNQHKCLTQRNNNVGGIDCDDNINQKWRTSDLISVIDSGQDSIATWKTQEGKNVVLIQPDIPWYVNKKKDAQKYMDNLNNNTYYDYAKFDSKFALDPSRPDMGYGYSYAQRHGKPCQCLECKKQNNVEHFDSSEKFSLNTFIFTLFFIVVALIIIRRYII
ncbi:hypothetical protein Klosneuvirus_1_253 [Klosneuvirus KNV1]|uniref:Uncharacterized protein n=1 Tax=Klosneuvirus KNV1 TaxID=1977640 RepID=A0A1V0SI42_9VIRU|nr:hypothetical protein Klosneuvirus_1_253 [Klosneuvirus KNV1]